MSAEIQRGRYIHYKQRQVSAYSAGDGVPARGYEVVTAKHRLGFREPVGRIVKRLRSEIEKASTDNAALKADMMAKSAQDLRAYAKADFESHVLIDGLWVVPFGLVNIAYRAYELLVYAQTSPTKLAETWILLAASRVGHSANRRRRLNREANKLEQA